MIGNIFATMFHMLSHLISPVVLSFFLGVLATRLKSDLRLPKELYTSLSIYLLLSLGLKGGIALSSTSFGEFFIPASLTLVLGIFFPFLTFVFTGLNKNFSISDRAALAAHYGSVSVVTFMASKTFVNDLGYEVAGFMTALVAILEIPGILGGLLIDKHYERNHSSILNIAKQIVVSKSVYILLGGLCMGWICGAEGIAPIKNFFIDPFQGVLVFFMLEMGIIAGERMSDVKKDAFWIVFFGLALPLLQGSIGVVLASWCGFSPAHAAVFGAMCASASYIAAPTIVRQTLPKANPAYYLSSALVVTFPFNLTLGIPLYYEIANLFLK